jgi:hypothetical protein
MWKKIAEQLLQIFLPIVVTALEHKLDPNAKPAA